MQSIWAENILTSDGWLKRGRVDIDKDGKISAVTEDVSKTGKAVGTLLPAPANIHSHSFQRAMAGMTEQRGDDPDDNFWSWRRLMYKFLDHLTPEDIEAIAAFTQMEMLEAGFGASVEFHYLHHQPNGHRYDNIAELSERIIAGANHSGIGLTLLPVLYQY
ncbi:MAG: formimidoylglutamate deiminase, partial [Acidimicrobiales bacterium]